MTEKTSAEKLSKILKRRLELINRNKELLDIYLERSIGIAKKDINNTEKKLIGLNQKTIDLIKDELSREIEINKKVICEIDSRLDLFIENINIIDYD